LEHVGVDVKRAIELFEFEERSSGSPLVTTMWCTHSVPEESFISVATTNWELVVTHGEDGPWITARGPETEASVAGIPPDAEFLGIPFRMGTFMPGIDLRRLIGGGIDLPMVSATSFWLDGTAWELPRADNADVFVDRLVRAGLLVHDPVVAAALHADGTGDGWRDGDDAGAAAAAGADLKSLSTRTVERRVARATGLTRGTIRQIRRAERAVELLGRGTSAPDVARELGYADQPHLTRSLRRFVGQTPSQIAAAAPSV
jgi:hypothetical protein